jgi:hypothetical protein
VTRCLSRGLEVIAVVRGFLIPHPFCLRFAALVMFGGIVKPAIAARMQIGTALRTLFAAADPFARFDADNGAAFPAVHPVVRLKISDPGGPASGIHSAFLDATP